MTLAVFNLEFRGLPHREATSANPAVAHAVIGIDTLLTQASKVLFGRVVEPEIDVRAGEGTGDFEVDLGVRVDAGKARCAALAGEPFYADPQPDVVLRALGFVAIERSPEELAALPEGWCDGLVALMLRLGGRQPEKIYLTGKNVDIDVGHEERYVVDKATYEKTLEFFDNLLKLLHPFMPFITEELWQHIYDRRPGESIMVQELHVPMIADNGIIKAFEAVKEVIGGIRTIRLQKNIAQKEALTLQVVGTNPVEAFSPVIMKLCNVSSVDTLAMKAEGAASFMVGTTEYAVPLGNLINVEEELKKLEADLVYQEGFLKSVMKKLGNEKFVSKAPANVIEMERKKQADAETKIAALEESIAALKKK